MIAGLVTSSIIVPLPVEHGFQTLITLGISLLGAGLISKAALGIFGNNEGGSMIGNTPVWMI